MYPRTNYEMSEDDLKEILAACRPTPVMFLSGGTLLGRSQQENANDAWRKLGEKMGFDYMTVRSLEGKGQRFFSAIPSETETHKTERLAREAQERNQAERIKLKAEIQEREEKLARLNSERQP